MKVNMFEAKSRLSELVRMLEMGEEGCITIARANQPVAEMRLCKPKASTKRIGIARGERLYADGWDDASVNSEVSGLFGVAQ